MLYRINFFIVINLKINNLRVLELLALETLTMLPWQGHGQTSTDIQAHNFYNMLYRINFFIVINLNLII